MTITIDPAEQLNTGCPCQSLDRQRLHQALGRTGPHGPLYQMIEEARPHLFSEVAVFVSATHLERMAQVVRDVEAVVSLPQYQAHVLAYGPTAARQTTAARSVFFGYDFHLGAEGPRLIEINTNAGGALLNAILARAQRACCEDVAALLPGSLREGDAESGFLRMFLDEWRLERGSRPLGTVAIVDADPPGQYMFPEFVLFQELFERAGIRTWICDPAELRFAQGRLWHGEVAIDLVYNRLTDFGLDQPEHAALREAWLEGGAVLTPHPRAHALYADKRNMAVLRDDALLASWGISAALRARLQESIPPTQVVRPEDADELWSRRRSLFFKPAGGFGSRAAYRGDKLTRRVFEEILTGGYVAQAHVPPSLRRLHQGADGALFKVDLRNFVYAGEVQLVSARLYQGQTTNFRTPGGGFAPVLMVPGGLVASG